MSHNYSTLFDTHDAEMLQDADNAITQCGLWDWMKTYTPDHGKGFSFTTHPNLSKINDQMKYTGHSGSSYAWTMRNMEAVAKDGWDMYCSRVLERRRDEMEESINAVKSRLTNIETIVSNLNSERVTNPTPLDIAEASRNVPGFEGQADAMKRFSEGKMTYAEMRSLCG